MNQTFNYVTLDIPNISIPDLKPLFFLWEFIPIPDQPQWEEDMVSAVKSFDIYLPNISLREYQGTFNHRVVLRNNEGGGTRYAGYLPHP